MGYKMPDNWGYNQIAGATLASSVGNVEIDKVAVAPSAPSVSPAKILRAPTAVEPYADGAGFDLLYSFAVHAELEAARTNSGLSGEKMARLGLGWARQERYTGGMWDIYLTENLVPEAEVESFGTKMSSWPYGNAVRNPGSECVDRDTAHFSATAFGCIKWRGETWDRPLGKFRMADLGGWAMDLLQLWGEYYRTGPSGGMEAWAASCVGAYGDPAFDRSDLMGDADAIVFASLLPQSDEVAFSDAIRALVGMSVKERLSRFYTLRFDSKEGNVIAAFQSLVDVEGDNPWTAMFTEAALLKAANADRLPNKYEAEAFAKGFVTAINRITAEG